MKKVIALVMCLTLLFSGCGKADTNEFKGLSEQNTQDTEEASVDVTISENDDTIIASFTGLDDKNLLQYVEDAVYADLVHSFDSEDYIIEEVDAVYVSKEYLEELAYNSQANIFFGYTIAEIIEQFDGEKFVFSLGEDGTTVVQEFKEYDDIYDKVIKNIAIGTGVILVCVTVSVVTGGVGLPAVSMVFAASAKTATTFALSSGVISGAVTTAVTGIQTKDMEQAVKAGALAGSESFKWGAFTGAITGGASKVVTLKKASNVADTVTDVIPAPRDSEIYALNKYGGSEQLTYLNGKEVAFGTPGATRPDVVRTIGGKLEAIEVKNYNLANPNNRNTLYKELERQITSRSQNLPAGSTQRIVLDARGRGFSDELIESVTSRIKSICSNVDSNIPIDVWR